MSHRNNLKTRVAFLLFIVLGLMHMGARVSRASAPCHALEFPRSHAIYGLAPRDVAVGDFDGDGNLDAVAIIVAGGFNGPAIALGDGHGQLMYMQFYSNMPFHPNGLAVGDFDKDGKLDVATAGASGSTIAIFYGDGDRSFPRLSYIETGSGHSNAVGGATDLNGDGTTDLVVTNKQNHTIQILFSRGNGQYELSIPYPVGTSPRGVIAGDFNGDGKNDIATANHDSGNVSVMLATDGTGNFSAATNYNVGHLPYAIVAADFNYDGKVDLAVVDDDYVSVLRNNGTGFSAPVDFAADGGDLSTSITVGDFNGDKKIDIATASDIHPGAGVSVLLGTGTGNFLTSIGLGFGRFGSESLAAGDFDGDGRSDLITQYSSKLLLTTTRCATPSHKIDYDGDNKTDIAVWRPSDGNWYILNSSFNTLRVEQWGMGSLGDRPVPGDYDGDGRADLAIFRSSTGTWYIRRSSDNSIQVQHFGVSSDRPVHGDYDGDLKTDIAVWRPADGTWYILQSSDGAFRAQQWGRQDLGDQPVQGDYDLDGKTDVAVLRTAEHRWFISNSSNGALRDVIWGTAGDVSLVYGMGGTADIAMWRLSNNSWYFYLGGGGGFVSLQGNGDVPVPGDYDGDGLTDAALLQSATGNWYIHRSGNTPINYHFGSAGDVPVSVPYLLEQ